MNPTLAIVTPHIGQMSETFIKRHIDGLLPGRTVVVATAAEPIDHPQWDIVSPSLRMSKWNRKPIPRMLKGAAAILGLPNPTPDWRVARFVKTNRVTHVLGEYMDETLPWIPLFERLKVKWYVQAHGIDVSVALRRPSVPERYRAYGSADAILTRSSHQRDRLIDLGLPRDRIHVNPGGVDVPDRYAEPPDEPEFRCLAVGRMVAKKAPIFLLDAFRRAILADNRVCLDYVGSGPMFSAAQQFVAAFRLDRNVTLHGGIDYAGLDALRRRASAFVQHSVTDPETGDQEGLPASLQEAMAAGLPVVSTRHAGIPEAITDGVHGFLVAEGDVEAMAGRIVELSRNRHLVLSLGRAGWQKALEEYTWHAEQRRVLSIMGIDLPATR